LQVRTIEGVEGPFLIVAPLSTLPHWERECSMWTEMYSVTFHGSLDSRRVILTHDWHLAEPREFEKETRKGTRQAAKYRYRFHCVITTFEMVVSHPEPLRRIKWAAMVLGDDRTSPPLVPDRPSPPLVPPLPVCSPSLVPDHTLARAARVNLTILGPTSSPSRSYPIWQVVDEGHRLKNRNSRALDELRLLRARRKLVLTGTPLQNHVTELWTILNFLEPRKFDDLDIFLDQYGALSSGGGTVQQVRARLDLT
jgi:SNF2 family DNA or RNA helicase